jgi:general secretion pathway protein A
LESSPPSAQAETKIEGTGIELVSDENEADARTRSIRDDTEEQVRPTYQVVSRVEENRPPSFLSFYSLNEQPFDVTPDPEYLYLTQTHREALDSLSQGIVNVRGFMTLIAEPGMGKTTLLNKLMEDLRDSTRIVFLFQTQCNSRELFRYLLSELGVENVAVDVVTMHKALNEILFQEMLMGRRFLLVIDEAQNLRDPVLETIRLLSDFETTHTKLIQIVLAGQSQLAERLMKPGLSQLRQRIAVLASLQPLSASETAQYVTHRLRIGGATGESIFTPEALALIAERSQGIPRNINNLCFNALLSGYSERVNPIDSALVQRVIAKSDLESLVRRPQ